MFKFKSLNLLIVLTITPFVLVLWFTQPIAAQQEDTSDVICQELQKEIKKDQELAEIVATYVDILRNQPISPEELAKLISEEENEKAKLLGIKITQNAPYEEAITSQLQLCYAPIWRDGRVVWNFPNPGPNGARYSVKPENGVNLLWAAPPEQWIDGIYRDHPNWGNCLARKIPDGATATFHSADSWDECYNAAACVAGACPAWINPCNLPDWPNAPLR